MAGFACPKSPPPSPRDEVVVVVVPAPIVGATEAMLPRVKPPVPAGLLEEQRETTVTGIQNARLQLFSVIANLCIATWAILSSHTPQRHSCSSMHANTHTGTEHTIQIRMDISFRRPDIDGGLAEKREVP